eukprot:11021365-Karenia_brevis.AAC.1
MLREFFEQSRIRKNAFNERLCFGALRASLQQFVHLHVELAERHVAELASKLRGARPVCVCVQPRLLEQACLDESLAE